MSSQNIIHVNFKIWLHAKIGISKNSTLVMIWCLHKVKYLKPLRKDNYLYLYLSYSKLVNVLIVDETALSEFFYSRL